jgi:hypothetical protein
MDPKHHRERSGQNRRRQAGTKATSARPATGGSGTRNRGWQSERGRSSGARPQAREKRPVRASPAGPVSALEVSPWSGQTVQVLLVGGRCVIGKLVSISRTPAKPPPSLSPRQSGQVVRWESGFSLERYPRSTRVPRKRGRHQSLVRSRRCMYVHYCRPSRR